MQKKRLITTFVIFLSLFNALCAEEIHDEYVRIRYDKENTKRSVAFETAIMRFELKNASIDSPTVDLIAAIHIADKEYYDELNKIFEDYDVVLYELVAEEGTRIDPEFDAENINKGVLGSFQSSFAKALNLQHQLLLIDYTKPNLVHADMSPDVFLKRMINEGEMGKIMGRAFSKSLTSSSSDSRWAGRMFGNLLASRDKTLGLRRAVATEMVNQIEEQLWVYEGDHGSTLIKERNAYALNKLREVINEGKKKIAIFYGAAHLYDFSERLENDFNMMPTQTRWVKAWDLGEKIENSEAKKSSAIKDQKE